MTGIGTVPWERAAAVAATREVGGKVSRRVCEKKNVIDDKDLDDMERVIL